MKRSAALLVCTLAFAHGQTPQPAKQFPSYKDLKFPSLGPIQIPDVQTYVLPNGIKLYLLEDHALPLVSGTARVRTGNLFDPPDKVDAR